jgi:NDP-sugar pyrophosphorylase family protein
VRSIPPHDRGPGPAIAAALEVVPDDAPVLVSYCDYGIEWDAAAFERFVRDSACDACVVTYRGFHAHLLGANAYARCRMDGERVVEVREKGAFTPDPVSEPTSAGAYYFRTAALLREALAAQESLGLLLGGEAYTSLTVEALLRSRPGAHVRVFEVPFFFQWGTPDDLRDFEYWERTFAAWNRLAGARGEVSQILMPMAGKGARFRDVSGDPKALIPVAGRPMFRAALDSLPRAGRVAIVALDAFADRLAPFLPEGADVVSLPDTPPGQAFSVRAGLALLDPDRDVVVSACDHAVVLDPAAWAAFRADPRCDAAIFTATGLPGAARRPQAWAYVVTEPDGSPFPRVARVSVKQPVSSDPRSDAVLVGTFWFASAGLLGRGIDALVRADPRVNGELYLDSVFDVLAADGARVRAIPLEGCVGWGDPDALAEALYWQDALGGRRLDARPRFPGVRR